MPVLLNPSPLNRIVIYVISLVPALPFQAFSQTFTLPPIPTYDSISIDEYQGVPQQKEYFLKGEKVFEIGYNTGSMFYVPFFAIGGGKEDSCYAYFTGDRHETYDFYYLDEAYVINEKFAENSKLFHYRKFTRDNKPMETGDYYFIKEMHNSAIAHNHRYKIGKWTTYDAAGKPATVVDYDRSTVNGKPLKFEGKMKIIDSLKALAAKKIIQVYGKSFYTKYVRFNLAQSGYYFSGRPRPEQPGGYSLLEPANEDIRFVDLSYDIVLEEERFNVIHFRISRNGEFLGRTYYPDFVRHYFHFTQGLDSLNNGRLHPSVINWKAVAKEKGMDIHSGGFNVRMDFNPTGNSFGELRLVLEQVTDSISTKRSFTNKLKRYFINPWTGAITEATEEEAVEGIMMDDG